MEETFKRYQDRVRFLYMYVREAHPNPDTAPCGSTEELGWMHPSSNTTTVEERAQRARWLKNDFDLSFPYVVDFMDNRIWSDYLPGGFYASWVIDCDGTALVYQPWAWATPATGWCGLPLATIIGLEQFLDRYLESPPQCYTGLDNGPYSYVVSAAAHAAGDNDTFWQTDLTVANPGPDPAAVTLFLDRWDQDNSSAEHTELLVEGGHAVELRDVVATEFVAEGAAAIRVESDRALVVAARTFNAADSGSFGQFIRGLNRRRAVGDPVTGHLLMLEESERFRTNIGVANLLDEAVEVEVRLFTGDGSELGVTNVSLPAHGATQLNRVLRMFTEDDVVGARAEVRVLTPQGRVHTYASLVDNATGDPTFVEALHNTHAVDITVAAAAKLAGTNETEWVTDVLLFNAGTSSASLTVARHDRDQDNSGADTALRTVEPGRTLLLRDALGDLWGTTGAASLAIHAEDGLVAVSRTFNDADTGTFGQYVPGMDDSASTTLRPDEVGHLVQLEQSADGGRRTNIGFVNLQAESVRVELRLLDASGEALGSASEHELPAYGFIQINSVLAFAGFPDLRNARAEVRVLTEGGRVLAYASSVDNVTGDPVFQFAVRVEER